MVPGKLILMKEYAQPSQTAAGGWQILLHDGSRLTVTALTAQRVSVDRYTERGIG